MIPSGKCLIVSHDAGGAEILSSFLYYYKIDFLLCIEGPAINIFEKRIGLDNRINLDNGMKFADWVLTGTGWSSEFEYESIKLAKNKKKYVISFLDHWINYRERFNWFGEEILPNKIWVADRYAKAISQKCFPEIEIQVIKNPYIRFQKDNYDKISIDSSKTYALYISENLYGLSKIQPTDETYKGFSDEDAFENFINNKLKCENHLGINRNLDIIIRPHPSERKELYTHIIKKCLDYKIIISNEESLLYQIKSSEYVVGLSSMAMVIAIELNKPVICAIPQKAKNHHYLPYKEIININSL